MANFIDPTDEGNNNGDNSIVYGDLDPSLGLGTFAQAKNGSQDTIGDELSDNQAIYDSYGNFTFPFSTQNRYINRRDIQFHCYFYTQRDEYDAYWVVGRNDSPQNDNTTTENEFDQELMGFHTDNQNKGIPTMEIFLFAYRNWEQILRPNDYVALRVFEAYPDDPYYLEHTGDTEVNPQDRNGVRHRTLMVGLISNIQVNETPQSGKVYVITCSGMQKVLANVQLGLPKEAQWNDVNLIYDINGASNPANESFPQYSKGGSSNSSSSQSSGKGPSKETGSSVMQGIIAFCNDKGYSVSQTAGVLASAQVESGEGHNLEGPDINDNNLLGYSPGSNTTGTGNNLPHNKQGAYKYCQFYWNNVEGPKEYDSNSRGKSAYDCGALFCAECDRPGGNTSTSSPQAQQRGGIAKGYASELS